MNVKPRIGEEKKTSNDVLWDEKWDKYYKEINWVTKLYILVILL